MLSDRNELIRRLNQTCRQAFDDAMDECKAHGIYSLEIDHFLAFLLAKNTTDAHHILHHYEIDKQNVLKQLKAEIDRSEESPMASTMISPHIFRLLEQAWLVSSLNFKEGQIRSAAIMMALLDDDCLRGILLEKCTLMLRVPRQLFKSEANELIAESVETAQTQAHLRLIAESPISANGTKSAAIDEVAEAR